MYTSVELHQKTASSLRNIAVSLGFDPKVAQQRKKRALIKIILDLQNSVFMEKSRYDRLDTEGRNENWLQERISSVKISLPVDTYIPMKYGDMIGHSIDVRLSDTEDDKIEFRGITASGEANDVRVILSRHLPVTEEEDMAAEDMILNALMMMYLTCEWAKTLDDKENED